MPTRALHEIQSERRELQAKLNRTTDEYDQLKARTDAGAKERAANLRTGLERGAERLSELVLEERDYVRAKMDAGTVGLEPGDGAADVATTNTKAGTATFGPAPTPWVPGVAEYRRLQTKAVGSAGAFVPVNYAAGFFDVLRKRTALLDAGPVLIPVVGAGSVRVPRITSSVTVSPVAEHATIPDATPGLGDIVLDPKKFAVSTVVSREAIEDSNPQLRDVVGQALIRDLAVELDRQMLVGSGAGGQILGLLNTAGTAAGPSTGANGGSLTFAALADTLAVAESNNADTGRLHWLMHSRTWSSVRKLVDSQGRPIVSVDPTVDVRPSLFGHPVHVSNSIPINQTVGTSTDCSSIALADMGQVVVAVGREVEVVMSEQLRFLTDEIVVKASARYDLGVPQPTGVVVTTGVRP